MVGLVAKVLLDDPIDLAESCHAYPLSEGVSSLSEVSDIFSNLGSLPQMSRVTSSTGSMPDPFSVVLYGSVAYANP